MPFINPLDFNEIFVNKLAGNLPIFGFLMFAVLSFLAAKFRMPNVIFISLFGLFIVYIYITTKSLLGFYVIATMLVIGAVVIGIKKLMQ